MEMKFGITVSYFLWSLALGGIMAFLYDLLRMTRRMISTSVFGVNLEDICFFLLGGLLLFWTAYDKNGGQLRWQGFFGAILGFGFYRAVLKDRLVKVLVWCNKGLIEAFLWVFRVLLFPVRVVYKMLAKPFLVIGWYSRERVRRVNGIFRASREQKKIREKCKKAEMEKRKKQRKTDRSKVKIAVDKG